MDGDFQPKALAAIRSIGAVWIAVIGLYVVSGIISPAMFQFSQILNILQVAAFLGVIALGQTAAVLTGEIDLSQAGMVTLTNIISTSIMLGLNENILVAMLVCIALALLVGVHYMAYLLQSSRSRH